MTHERPAAVSTVPSKALDTFVNPKPDRPYEVRFEVHLTK